MAGRPAGIASVAEYIASQPKDVRPTLRRVRAAIRKALPKAVETLSYKIPTYRLERKAVIYFAAWTHHYSIYPATRTLVAALGDDLAGLDIEKGTIRLSYDTPVPAVLIARIAKFRAREARPKRRP
jgi:uncharacterized protein YdhG (YjbR/CyaY superfamily)